MAERALAVGEVGVCLNLGTGDWCLIREPKRGPSMTLRTYKRVGFQKFERVQPWDTREGRVHLRRASPGRGEVIGWWPRVTVLDL